MRCHEVDFQILGESVQLVEIELDPSETVIAEAGAMNYMEEDIHFEAKMGDGSATGIMGKLFDMGKRVLSGESLFVTHFTNQGRQKRKVAFSAPYPGKIVALNLAQHNEEIICQKDSFLAAALGTEVTITLTRKLGAGFFGGEGFILQKIKGDGMAFLHAGGHVIKKELQGQTLRIDTGSLVGFTKGIEYDVALAGGLKSMIFGGEGLFLTTLKGHGTVWLQSLPLSRMANRIVGASMSGKEGSSLID